MENNFLTDIKHLLSSLFKKILYLLPPLNGAAVIILILVFVLGWELGHRDYTLSWQNYAPNVKIINQTPQDKNISLDFSLFWQTWNLLFDKYFDKKDLDPRKLYYGAIQGMVAAAGDPYTMFLPPQAQKETSDQLGGSFEGVGIELGYNKDKNLVVIAPLKGTPADKAGIKPGDIIAKINGKDASTTSLPDAVNLIRGPKGSQVTLTVIREGADKPLDISITRGTIEVKTVEYSLKTTQSGKKVAYISVSQFGEKTDQEWDEAVTQALADSPQGVIIDLRNNPGGFLDDAVYMASEFLDGGVVVKEEDSEGNITSSTVSRTGRMLKLPMVVLINKGSASASEIFSGAMQDRGRAILVGDQSFGKGTIQTAMDLPENTGIHITIAKWLTPNSRWIHGIGLTPDVKVDQSGSPTQDTQLEKALQVLDTKI